MNEDKGDGISHPLQDLVQEVRKIFLVNGFNEVENPLFIPEEDVYKQYGFEAPVVLDRCYYLAGLPRPDIGLSHDEVAAVKKIDSRIDISILKKIFRSYREGLIEGDDLVERMVKQLNIKEGDAVMLIELFPAFKEITAEASKLTLRSHMTAGWFLTLESYKELYEPPYSLFSVGLRFRREQKVDATHLRAHYGASCVLVKEGFTLKEGMKLSSQLLEMLGFDNLDFVKKTATSNYYEKNTEYEIFSDGIEIADCGLYSSDALRNYGLEYPVFNLGFGLERILMLRDGVSDIREVVYPQFYGRLNFSDEEIAKRIRYRFIPETDEGRELVEAIINVALKNAQADSPCEFPVWEGVVGGVKLNVYIVERESGKKLLGPAALNEVYVCEGGIYGIPGDVNKFDNKIEKIHDGGLNTKKTFLEAAANLFAYKIENETKQKMQVGMVKRPADINIEIDKTLRRYITSHNKKMSIKGPVFISIEVKK